MGFFNNWSKLRCVRLQEGEDFAHLECELTKVCLVEFFYMKTLNVKLRSKVKIEWLSDRNLKRSNAIMLLKILLMGIAKAGKTSILLALDNKTEEFAKVMPTKGIKYKQMQWAGFSMALWDVAGQEVYQKKFLAEHERNFVDVNAILFVISVEEEDSFKDAFTLLKNVVDILEKM